jgi:hypothetical protein
MPPTGNAAATRLKVVFGKDVDQRDYDRRLFAFCQGRTRPAARLCLDFSQTRYFSLEVLISIIALLVDRQSRGLETTISLPNNSRTDELLHFLRGWRFFDAIETATGREPADFLREEDEAVLAAHVQDNPEPKYVGGYVDPTAGRILSDKYFGLRAFPLDEGVPTDGLPLVESDRWEERLIRNVIDHHLGGTDSTTGLVSSTVVFETFANALRHPSARTIVATSQLERARGSLRTGGEQGRNVFRFVCWDDGESIIHTMRDALDDDREVIVEVSDNLHRTYLPVSRKPMGRGIRQPLINSRGFRPSAQMDNATILLSTLFPGITSDIAGTGHTTHPELVETLASEAGEGFEPQKSPELMGPGMGLFLLLHTAADVFVGSLQIRAEDCEMEIVAASDALKQETGADYIVTTTQFGEGMPSFRGNLLSVVLRPGTEAKSCPTSISIR